MAALVQLAFWAPPAGLALFLVRWLRRQPVRKGRVAATALAAALAMVAWWFVLIGVIGGAALAVSDLIDGYYGNAALLAALLLAWTVVMVLVIRRARRRTELPYEIVNFASLCAIVLGVPLVGLVMIASVI
jgi:hypothetical protein